jgi:hypothetical protein
VRGLKKLETLAAQNRIEDWRGILLQAENNLRLFYLVIGLTQRCPDETQAFIREVETESDFNPDTVWRRVKFLSSFVPSPLLRWVWNWYQSNPAVALWLRRMFNLGAR